MLIVSSFFAGSIGMGLGRFSCRVHPFSSRGSRHRSEQPRSTGPISHEDEVGALTHVSQSWKVNWSAATTLDLSGDELETRLNTFSQPLDNCFRPSQEARFAIVSAPNGLEIVAAQCQATANPSTKNQLSTIQHCWLQYLYRLAAVLKSLQFGKKQNNFFIVTFFLFFNSDRELI